MKKQTSTRLFLARVFTVGSVAALTALNVRADYQSTVLADNPLAFYAVNPGGDVSSTEPDLTGNQNYGAVQNVTAINGPSAHSTIAGYCNATSSLIDLSPGANTGILNFSGPITLEAWVQTAPTSSYSGL